MTPNTTSTARVNAVFPSARVGLVRSLVTLCALLTSAIAWAQAGNRLVNIDANALPGQQVELRLRTDGMAPEPLSFTIDNPARISLDLPGTSLALDSRRKDVELGPLRTILAAEANGRTRVVLNLDALVPSNQPLNLAHLLVGSEGTLAVSTALEIKLSPLPSTRASTSPNPNPARYAAVRTPDVS